MDLICFSHLGWNFVYQRPQHLLSRFTVDYRVFYIQEFSFKDNPDGWHTEESAEGVWVISPHLKNGPDGDELQRKRVVIDQIFEVSKIGDCILWYYTPMSILYSGHLQARVVVYDCMDELSAFKFADPQLKTAENKLFEKADLVFTGGKSLYEVKKHFHDNVHLFPSSIDQSHFRAARHQQQDPGDQLTIAHPRLGFFGVIDERFDIDLIEEAAILKPGWQFVLIGPIVKIDPAQLPRRSNIHYLGSKSYKELPAYLANWDIALIPFARNESTRFISPTKTPEYLAAGKPVISTPIQDVLSPYGEELLVQIAGNANELVNKAAAELEMTDKSAWLKKVDSFLADMSWDQTWQEMHTLIQQHLQTVSINDKNTNLYV